MQLRVRLQIGLANLPRCFLGLAVLGFLNGLNGWGLFVFAYGTTKTCTQNAEYTVFVERRKIAPQHDCLAKCVSSSVS